MASQRRRQRRIRGGVCAGLGACLLGGGLASTTHAQELRELRDSVRALQEEVGALRSELRSSRARGAATREQVTLLSGALARVRFGGYGAVRWENTSLGDVPNTFTFRRLVLTSAAELSDRLRFYSEIEYERFRKLELERNVRPLGDTEPGSRGIVLVQEIEGTDSSEIALEQAWLEFDLTPTLHLRTGGVLVPLGRFNSHHDDNQWNLTRRPLVDRGAPVLPVAAAWDELGIGLLGELEVGEGRLAWELYVVNGMTLEAELEQVVAIRSPKRDKIELELEFAPQTGTFANDVKEAKALTGRIAWQPPGGHELAFSFYRGRYTPSYLADETAWSLALDGLTRVGGLEIEGEYVFTRFTGVRTLVASLAEVALESSVNNPSIDDPIVETEIEIDVKNLADAKHGYWLELRYPFWPQWLSNTPLGRGFRDPRLIPVLRWEQVFFQDRLTGVAFSGGKLTSLTTESRVLSRLSLGLAYRPLPLVAFSLAYEYLFTHGKGLDGLTDFLPAGVSEDRAHFFTAGATFGF